MVLLVPEKNGNAKQQLKLLLFLSMMLNYVDMAFAFNKNQSTYSFFNIQMI